jgi:hypothetical protein
MRPTKRRLAATREKALVNEVNKQRRQVTSTRENITEPEKVGIKLE